MSLQQLKETMELLHKGGAVPLNVVEAVNDLLEENEKRLLEAQDWEDEYHALKRRYEELDKSALEKHELLMDTTSKFQAVSKELEEKEIILTGRQYTINRLKEQNEEIATMGIRQGEQIYRLLQTEKKQFNELEEARKVLKEIAEHGGVNIRGASCAELARTYLGQEGEGNQEVTK